MSNKSWAELLFTGGFSVNKPFKDMKKSENDMQYENFPWCCSSKNVSRRDTDLSKAPMPQSKLPKFESPEQFWNPVRIGEYSNLRSAFRCSKVTGPDGGMMYTALPSEEVRCNTREVTVKYETLHN